MWLLDAKTRKLEEFYDDAIPKYAILSHTWGKKGDEVFFEEMRGFQWCLKSKEGYKKIEYTCAQALRDNIFYVWIDTCCINKRSSAELSEAINSMFQWYKNAEVCYVYLSDVGRSPSDRNR